VFLLGHAIRQDEAEALEGFNSVFAGTDASPSTAVGVLSRADQVGSGEGDPLAGAREIAAAHAGALRSVAATVVPVAGLLAETVESGSLAEGDALELQSLAAQGPPARDRFLFSHDEFLRAELPVPTRIESI
jgi:hypothetical protein